MPVDLALVNAIIYAVIDAGLFTVSQNTLNKKRGKVKAWIFAIVVWLGLKLLVVAFMTL